MPERTFLPFHESFPQNSTKRVEKFHKSRGFLAGDGLVYTERGL